MEQERKTIHDQQRVFPREMAAGRIFQDEKGHRDSTVWERFMSKRIIYQVVTATAEQNESMAHKIQFRSFNLESAKKFAEGYRKANPGMAFVVLEERHEVVADICGLWEIDHDAGGEKALDYF